MVFLCSYSGTSSTWNTGRGWGSRNQPTSCQRSEAIGKKLCVPPQGHPGPPARPHLGEWWAGLTPHLWGRRERRNTKILHLLLPRQLLTSPSGVWFACTRDLDSLSMLGLSRAWSSRDTELLQHLFVLCRVMKPQYCWKKKIQTATEGEGREEK